MRYYVIASDGQKYGPADLATLKEWVEQGRITTATMLEEEIGSARLVASGLTGLFSASTPYSRPVDQQGPYQSNSSYTPPSSQPNLSNNPYASPSTYYRGDAGHGPDPLLQRMVNNSWIAGAVGLGIMTIGFCCFVTPLASIGLSIWGISSGRKAQMEGHVGGQAPFIFNIVVLVVALGVLAFHLLFFGFGAFL